MALHPDRRCRGWRTWRPPALLGLLAVAALLAALPGPAAAAPPPTIPGATYVGSDTCKGCHEDQFTNLHGPHGKLVGTPLSKGQLQARGCEACHGPGSKHVENQADPATIIRFSKKSVQPTEVRSAACLQCHERGGQLLWRGSQHDSRDLTCATCHSAHGPAAGKGQVKIVKAIEQYDSKMTPMPRVQFDLCGQCHQVRAWQFTRYSHMPLQALGEAGKITCSTCHNPHGSPLEKLVRGSISVNESCTTCHTDKRGPFIWEHPPVLENCMNCHQAHGSNNPTLLKVKQPRLCQQCHSASSHPSRPYWQADKKVFARSCVNCHSIIHGSNHPSGSAFTR